MASADPRPIDDTTFAEQSRDGAERSKHDRGHVVVVGGSAQTPGAVLLAGTAAVRVGAGVAQLATARSVAPQLAVAFPEARVLALDEEGPTGAPCPDDRLRELAARADALLVGPGSLDRASCCRLLEAVVDALSESAALVVDAGAIDCFTRDEGLRRVSERTILTPNVDEASRVLDRQIRDADDVARAATSLAAMTGAVVAVRGAVTVVAQPYGEVYEETGGHPVLAMSGSGDVLVGAVAGLACRGSSPLAAAVRGVHIHACAGARLAASGPPRGRMARELLDEL